MTWLPSKSTGKLMLQTIGGFNQRIDLVTHTPSHYLHTVIKINEHESSVLCGAGGGGAREV